MSAEAGTGTVAITNKELTSRYFTPVQDKPGTFECKCGSVNTQKGSGYPNLLNHIKNKHKDDNILTSNQTVLDQYFDPKVAQIYGWMDWIVTKGLPFTFCEDETNRKYCRLKPLSYKTFMKYLGLVTTAVEKEIGNQLPTHFGIVFDGWSDSSVHYVGLFACFCDANGEPLYPFLAFSPLLDETDLGSNSYKEWISATLELYGKSLDAIIFIVGDNCAVNQSLCQIMDTAFVGCASHRLNLAVKAWINDNNYGLLVEKVNSLMIKLRTFRAKLRELTPLAPMTKNETRWSSTYNMIKRFVEIEPCIDVSDPEIADRSLSPAEMLRVEVLLSALEEYNSIYLELQKSTVTISDARACFDAVMQKYSDFGHNHVSADSRIVCQKDFENAIVKIQRSQEDELSACERMAV